MGGGVRVAAPSRQPGADHDLKTGRFSGRYEDPHREVPFHPVHGAAPDTRPRFHVKLSTAATAPSIVQIKTVGPGPALVLELASRVAEDGGS